MKCDELLARLTDYAEGAVEGSVCAEIERHLEECASCEGLRQELEQVAQLCRQAALPRLPDDVRKRIEDLLRASGR